jgi:hypothetical protein
MVFFYTACEGEANKKFISHIKGPPPHILNPSESDLSVELSVTVSELQRKTT